MTATRSAVEPERKHSWAEAVLGVVVIIPITVVLWGYMLARAWAWFLVPVFHTPGLPLVNSAGIALAAEAVLTPTRKPTGESLGAVFGRNLGAWALAMLGLLVLAQFA